MSALSFLSTNFNFLFLHPRSHFNEPFFASGSQVPKPAFAYLSFFNTDWLRRSFLCRLYFFASGCPLNPLCFSPRRTAETESDRLLRRLFFKICHLFSSFHPPTVPSPSWIELITVECYQKVTTLGGLMSHEPSSPLSP